MLVKFMVLEKYSPIKNGSNKKGLKGMQGCYYQKFKNESTLKRSRHRFSPKRTDCFLGSYIEIIRANS